MDINEQRIKTAEKCGWTKYEISLTKDGNAWIALIGENLQDGVCGCGETPSKALNALAVQLPSNTKNIITSKTMKLNPDELIENVATALRDKYLDASLNSRQVRETIIILVEAINEQIEGVNDEIDQLRGDAGL